MSKRPKIEYGSPAGGTQPAAAKAGGPKGGIIAIGAAVGALLIVLVVFAVRDGGGNDQNNTAFQSATVEGTSLPQMEGSGLVSTGDAAQGMTVPTVIGKDFDGNEVRLEPGKPTVAVVMAHWCPHCQAEIPKIVEWSGAGDLSDEVQIIGISSAANESQGNFPPASWLAKENWTFPVIVDTRGMSVQKALGISSYPGMIAIRADGTVAMRASGELPLAEAQRLWSAALGTSSGETTPGDTTADTTADTTTTTAAS